jgi:hydroxylamine reductase (hybrid-cluster protein)
MTTSISAIETLFTNNIINYDTRASLIKRVERLEAKEESRKLVQGTADAIIALLESEVQTETKYFSVKKTQNSVGFMDFVMTDRATVLKALTLLVSQDKIKKIGLVGGVEKLPNEVNAFQIRYTRA